ncbi:MAG: 4-phosphoerythronate dehydrogenase [Muribaculaceae bacterium]|nr:4-phosphoerythronate dehydrogenase [Muribaculaceae bacterium]
MRIVVDSHIPNIRGCIEPRAEVLYLEPGDITRDAVSDADALIVRTRTRCDAALLGGSRVRFIGSATIGTDHIDLNYCSAHGITVRNAPGCNAPAVAQWVFCAIRAWMQARDISTTEDLTLGIVGVGHIGSIVARWGRQLGFTVLLNDPPRENAENMCMAENTEKTEKTERMGTAPDLTFLPLEELQRRCDIITFHTPLTRGGQWPTWHLCDQAFLDGLERCRLLIDAARGPIADNAALRGWHGDIALDCWENEPSISRELLEKAVVATPHIAGYSAEGKQRGTAMMLEALNEFYGWDIPVPEIAAPATGAPDVTFDGIAASYDILADSAALKADATAFESLRNTYHHRPEYQ